MKKIILAVSCIAGISLASNAQTGTLHGFTKQSGNKSGGTTTTCPTDPTKICTTNTKNPNGTHTIAIYKYDQNGNLTGVQTVVTQTADQWHIPNPQLGYIHDVQIADFGMVWAKMEE